MGHIRYSRREGFYTKSIVLTFTMCTLFSLTFLNNVIITKDPSRSKTFPYRIGTSGYGCRCYVSMFAHSHYLVQVNPEPNICITKNILINICLKSFKFRHFRLIRIVTSRPHTPTHYKTFSQTLSYQYNLLALLIGSYPPLLLMTIIKR